MIPNMTKENAFKYWCQDDWEKERMVDCWMAACTWQQEQIMDNILDALQSDLENGVKWLNEKASDDFSKKYPALYQVIKELNV